jgi:hypothetical protein
MEKEEAKKLKQKQRDRMSAKTGKMDIAYEVCAPWPGCLLLHAASASCICQLHLFACCCSSAWPSVS